MKIFFDTSALAKRYLLEPGSEEVMKLFSRGYNISISVTCIPEMIRTLNRLRVERKFDLEVHGSLKKNFLSDVAHLSIIEFNPDMIAEIIFCIEKTSLRTLDAIHVGSARFARADLFVSTDADQLHGTKLSGLKTRRIG